jgi:hypothetical protein
MPNTKALSRLSASSSHITGKGSEYCELINPFLIFSKGLNLNISVNFSIERENSEK